MILTRPYYTCYITRDGGVASCVEGCVKVRKEILERRTRHAILRCSDVEWERFGRAAGKLSFSEWARKALLSECELFEAEEREKAGK